VVAALMTSFYSWRLMFMTFYGAPRDKKHWEEAHESPNTMMIPLYVLAAGSVLAGMIWYGDFVGHHAEEFFGEAIAIGESTHVLHGYHEVPVLVKLAAFIAMLAGLGLAWLFYIRNPELPKRLAEQNPGFYQFLLNKWYFDEAYDFLFVRPAKWLGDFLWRKGDGRTIDGVIDGLAMGIIPYLTSRAVRFQSGYIFHYAFAMLVGVAALITWFAIRGGN